jgi:hypothetical protein
MTFKLVFMQFLNSGMISILTLTFLYIRDFRFYKSLICTDMLLYMLMNVVINNPVNFLFVRFKIPALLDRLMFHFRWKEYTQAEANKIF